MSDADALRKKIDEVRLNLLQDLSQQELENMQMKVDMLMRLAALDGGHDHDTQGGVGHHDHHALADLSWRLEQPRRVVGDIEK
jgi:hypothetical protein